jgi:putative ABC transport system permease protein
MEQYLAASIAPRRFNLWLLSVFAGTAMVLAATGLYAVVRQGVSQRQHEIGIRMTLGANRKDVLRLVIGQGMALALIGIALGLLCSFAMTRWMAPLLFGVTATDPTTFATLGVFLALIALLASYFPARSAASVDPVVALRRE